MYTSSKLEAMECAEKSWKEAAAREFGLDTKRICIWCSLVSRSRPLFQPQFLYGNHIKIEAGIAVGYARLGVVRRPGAASNNEGENKKRMRLDGAGRKPKFNKGWPRLSPVWFRSWVINLAEGNKGAGLYSRKYGTLQSIVWRWYHVHTYVRMCYNCFFLWNLDFANFTIFADFMFLNLRLQALYHMYPLILKLSCTKLSDNCWSTKNAKIKKCIHYWSSRFSLHMHT